MCLWWRTLCSIWKRLVFGVVLINICRLLFGLLLALLGRVAFSGARSSRGFWWSLLSGWHSSIAFKVLLNYWETLLECANHSTEETYDFNRVIANNCLYGNLHVVKVGQRIAEAQATATSICQHAGIAYCKVIDITVCQVAWQTCGRGKESIRKCTPKLMNSTDYRSNLQTAARTSALPRGSTTF